MATGVSTSWGGPEVNKIEQVSIDGHQMSLARGGTKFGVSLYSESNALWVMVRSPSALVNRQTDKQTLLKILPSHNFVGGW